MTIGGEKELGALCAVHPDRAAIGTCDRCGSFYCPSCFKDLAGKKLCAECLKLPGVDYLAEARDKAWGKRDAWVWYFGLFAGFGASINAVASIAIGALAPAVGAALVAATAVAYFMLVPWSRTAIWALVPLSVINAVLGDSIALAKTGASGSGYMAGYAFGSALVLTLFLLAAHRSTRNKLAFKLEVTDQELARYYNQYLSNPSASRALAYGLLSLAIPLLIPFGIGFGVRGMRRATKTLWPPVGGTGRALVGLLASAVSTLFWALVIVGLALAP